MIGDQFSFTEKIELKWLNHLTIGLLLIWAVVILSNLTWELLKIQLPFDKEYIIYTSFSIFIFVIGYKGLKQGIIFIHIAEDAKVIISSRAKPKGPTIEEGAYDEKCQQIIQKLISYMDTEKPYLEEKLMLMDVAIHLNIPHYQLTKIFNDHLNTTFFNFINQYRVDYFKKRIVDPTNNAFTILAVAYDCGFASKASFNRIFKRFTNQTPSEFKHSLK